MKVKLITFDVTNTLLRMRGSVGEHYAAAANKYYGATKLLFHPDRTGEVFVKAYAEATRQKPNFGYNNGVSSEDWWHEVVHKVFSNLGLNDPGVLRSISNQLYTDYCSKEKYELFPEVHGVLRKLRQNDEIKLGIISNFDERLDMILEQLEIRHFFDFVLCSRLIGAVKPDPIIFTTAQILSGVLKASEALHIGDDIELDYNAAQAVGFNALLINQKDVGEDSLIKRKTALKVIDSLTNVLDFTA